MPLHPSTYDTAKSYDWNYQFGPVFAESIPARPASEASIDFLGFPLRSRLGVAAGPLLNSRWTNLYFQLGWDVLVYKTVRSISRLCHPVPNCVFVDPGRQLAVSDSGGELRVAGEPDSIASLSITNSFGVPSRDADCWQADFAAAQAGAGEGQLLICSINGTPGAGGRELADDFAFTAAMARDAGAKIIEANFSCPNVGKSKEGQIYADPEAAAEIARRIRLAVGPNFPVLIKMGSLPEEKLLEVVRGVAPHVSGFAGINTVPMQVRDAAGEQALPGEGRLVSGICGACIRDTAQAWTESMVRIRAQLGADFALVGVGGLMTESDFDARLTAGADVAMSATSAMWDPLLASRFHSR